MVRIVDLIGVTCAGEVQVKLTVSGKTFARIEN